MSAKESDRQRAHHERLEAHKLRTTIKIHTGRLSETVDAPELAALCASPIACAVADAWVMTCKGLSGPAGPWVYVPPPNLSSAQRETLNALEAVTRPSPLRKVIP